MEEVTGRLVARLHERGAAALDLDGALVCHALDVIGKVVTSSNPWGNMRPL